MNKYTPYRQYISIDWIDNAIDCHCLRAVSTFFKTGCCNLPVRESLYNYLYGSFINREF